MGSESRETKNNSSSGRKLQGSRPSALRLGGIKKSSHGNPNRISKAIKPLVIYLSSPKIIHVSPDEFMNVVQRLTGKDSTNKPSSALMSPIEDDESMKKMSKWDTLFDGDDQVLGMSPTSLHFLACV
ncbi:VQ motif-containing protein 8, chloroplastic-like [Hibiscus syriacus]|uniref:VQ motif-containing protein 8, chloroplastic-like n=1 Tax=Hibiscus syriacus TaxID=106335 RepID=UPI001923B3A7|nr:VQ motif-containing protein 8, chloroplastic-like [Hibiscus syriacus]